MSDTLAEMAKKIAKLEVDNAALKAQAKATTKGLSLKVSEKGALSIYGMGRFPVTLYKEQWERLLADTQVQVIKEFIVAHASEFSSKVGGLATSATVTKGTGDSATAPASLDPQSIVKAGLKSF